MQLVDDALTAVQQNAPLGTQYLGRENLDSGIGGRPVHEARRVDLYVVHFGEGGPQVGELVVHTRQGGRWSTAGPRGLLGTAPGNLRHRLRSRR